MGRDYIPAPDWCTDVGPECPVTGTTYGYAPNLGANLFFTIFFGLCLIIQLGAGIKYKTWTYLIGLGFGCLGEMIGYIGRLIMHYNAFSSLGFQIQICCLIIAPAFISAGVYLTLKHLVLNFGTRWSRIRPGWYTWLFIGGDLLSLVMQGAGGGIAATADPGSSALDVGTNLMLAGIIWQVVCLAFFGYFLAEYAFRTHRHKDELTSDSVALLHRRSFQLFIGAIFIAYVTILVRCIYRIPELAGGWGSKLMRDEGEFIALDGVMITIAVLVLTVFHPGYCFPALGNTIGQRKYSTAKTVSDSDTEMISSRV